MSTIQSQPMKLIAVVGPKGSGKTTFVNMACGSAIREDSNMYSCTDRTQTATCSLDGQTIIMIDTPGFDDTDQARGSVLHDIASLLEQRYGSGRKLDGLIYVCHIPDSQENSVVRQASGLFDDMCGKGPAQDVTIAASTQEGHNVSNDHGAAWKLQHTWRANTFDREVVVLPCMASSCGSETLARDVVRSALQSGTQNVYLQNGLIATHGSLWTVLHRQPRGSGGRVQGEEMLDESILMHRATHRKDEDEMIERSQETSCEGRNTSFACTSLEASAKDTAWRWNSGRFNKFLSRNSLHISRSGRVTSKGFLHCLHYINLDN